MPGTSAVRTERLTAGYGSVRGVYEISLEFAPNRVHALIGPSGCGKSTFLRALNRLHEETPGAWVRGHVEVNGEDIYAPSMSPMALRRRVGMVFQKPTPFPFMSIAQNVAAGLVLERGLSKSAIAERVEESLRQAALWDEVKDRLGADARGLSGGQQQRLCIARTIAPRPAIVLLDEPTASLDPQGTQRIEELMFDLKRDFTIIMVTHNMRQAARVADTTTFFYLGGMVEHGETDQVFTAPHDSRTKDYVTGRFG
ncbi:MAG TPA: phosphate ABC transporter ATP-binding protein [Gemmatimonadaceae bacterium]|nr:phosphate ABC transporter ATP-binding protein [Gemmatimonadaceae bacterium]